MKPIVPSSSAVAYMQLRTMLDSLEIGAIRYYLMAGDAPGKQHRYIALDEKLMPIINWLWAAPGVKSSKPEVGYVECPPGYVDCNGCCVPYPCPDLGTGMEKPKPKPKPKP
jgi:hypothetical protein